jgi:hypothetical protein
MTFRTRALALFALTTLGFAAPAFAAPAVPDDANKALWCATAFTIVEPQARQAGDTAAADNFKKYADTLTGTSHDSMSKAGFSEADIKATGIKYVDAVTKELTQDGAPEFSVVDCTTLVDPAAAAAIKTAPAAPAAAAPAPAPAAPAAPAPAAPAPASK